jgi:tartrate-resistant acid phosphatase type 5
MIKFYFFMQAHGVDLYINGHDHCLEQISSSDRSVQMNCQPNKVYHIFVPFISDREEGSSFPVCFACSPLQYLTSGGGSKAWGVVYTPGADKVKFFHDGQGFMSLRLTATEARLAFYDVAGSVLHTWGHTKPAHY